MAFLLCQILIFLGVFFTLTNWLGISLFKALFTAILIISTITLTINGQFFSLIVLLFCSFSAMGIYANAESNKVRFKFTFSLITFLFPLIGLPIYFALKNGLSQKYSETIKTDGSRIQILNR